MSAIRSPLGALGALMALVQSVTAGALFAVRSNPLLQLMLVVQLIVVTSIITLLVISLIIYFTRKNPGLLFSPQDIDSSVHERLYLPPDKVVLTPERVE